MYSGRSSLVALSTGHRDELHLADLAHVGGVVLIHRIGQRSADRNYDEYPETGCADDELNVEMTPGPMGIILNPLRVFLHPFTMIFRRGI